MDEIKGLRCDYCGKYFLGVDDGFDIVCGACIMANRQQQGGWTNRAAANDLPASDKSNLKGYVV